MCGSPFVIFIDGLDMMEKTHQPYNLEWLPRNLPKVWEQFHLYSFIYINLEMNSCNIFEKQSLNLQWTNY